MMTIPCIDNQSEICDSDVTNPMSAITTGQAINHLKCLSSAKRMMIVQKFCGFLKSRMFFALLIAGCACLLQGCSGSRQPSIKQATDPIALINFMADSLEAGDFEAVIRIWNPQEIIKGGPDTPKSIDGDYEQLVHWYANKLAVEQKKNPIQFNHAVLALRSITTQDIIWIQPGVRCRITNESMRRSMISENGSVFNALLELRLVAISGRWYWDS